MGAVENCCSRCQNLPTNKHTRKHHNKKRKKRNLSTVLYIFLARGLHTPRAACLRGHYFGSNDTEHAVPQLETCCAATAWVIKKKQEQRLRHTISPVSKIKRGFHAANTWHSTAGISSIEQKKCRTATATSLSDECSRFLLSRSRAHVCMFCSPPGRLALQRSSPLHQRSVSGRGNHSLIVLPFFFSRKTEDQN